MSGGCVGMWGWGWDGELGVGSGGHTPCKNGTQHDLNNIVDFGQIWPLGLH